MRIQLYLLFTTLALTIKGIESFSKKMTWSATWNNILQGGPKRWKVDDLEVKKKALSTILQYVNDKESSDKNCDDRPLKILCPLAGDDPFVQYAWSQGHDVTAIDLVPAAVQVMREQFGGSESDWIKEISNNGASQGVMWKHNSGRATLYEGDVLEKRPELNAKFDAIYDKDSFGALTLDIRQAFCKRLSEYTKDEAIVYIEVKNKEFNRDAGPPFHVEKKDLMQETNFGSDFEHISALGEVYSLGMNGVSQTGHILKRVK